MNREIYSEAFTRNRLPDDAVKDLNENVDVLKESYLRLKSIAIQLMTSSSSSLERSEQLEESKTDRDEQRTLTSYSCSSSRMLESVGDVDKIVKCARDNIDEASKILANLKHRKLQNK